MLDVRERDEAHACCGKAQCEGERRRNRFASAVLRRFAHEPARGGVDEDHARCAVARARRGVRRCPHRRVDVAHAQRLKVATSEARQPRRLRRRDAARPHAAFAPRLRERREQHPVLIRAPNLVLLQPLARERGEARAVERRRQRRECGDKHAEVVLRCLEEARRLRGIEQRQRQQIRALRAAHGGREHRAVDAVALRGLNRGAQGSTVDHIAHA